MSRPRATRSASFSGTTNTTRTNGGTNGNGHTNTNATTSTGTTTTSTGSARERRNRRLAAMHHGLRGRLSQSLSLVVSPPSCSSAPSSPSSSNSAGAGGGGGGGGGAGAAQQQQQQQPSSSSPSPRNNGGGGKSYFSFSPPLSPKSPSKGRGGGGGGGAASSGTNHQNLTAAATGVRLRPSSPHFTGNISNSNSNSNRPPINLVSPSSNNGNENGGFGGGGINNNNPDAVPAGLQQPQLTLAPRYRTLVAPRRRSPSSDLSVSSEVMLREHHQHQHQHQLQHQHQQHNQGGSCSHGGFAKRQQQQQQQQPYQRTFPATSDSRSVASESNIRILGTVPSAAAPHAAAGNSSSSRNLPTVHVVPRTASEDDDDEEELPDDCVNNENNNSNDYVGGGCARSVYSDSRLASSSAARRPSSPSLTRQEIHRLAAQRITTSRLRRVAAAGGGAVAPAAGLKATTAMSSSASLPGELLSSSRGAPAGAVAAPPGSHRVPHQRFFRSGSPTPPTSTLHINGSGGCGSAYLQQQQLQHHHHGLRSYSPTPPESPGRVGGGVLSASAFADDDVSSLGGVEDQASAVQRITLALRNGSARPSSLTREERALWDAIQSTVRQAKCDKGGKSSNSSGTAATSCNSSASSPRPSTPPPPQQQQQQQQQEGQATPSSPVDWKQKFSELQEKTAVQEIEHLSSLRAIQRVLADATAERDRALNEQKRLRCEQEAAAVAASSACREGPEDDSEERKKELQALMLQISSKDARIRDLEDELHKVREESSTHSTSDSLDRQKEEFIRQRLETAEAEKNRLAKELESSNEEISKLSRRLLRQDESSAASSGELADLRKQVSDKSAALESAKMIIASLESASGKLASDMRAKIKIRDDEVHRLKAEATDRQRTLDSLATQLRDSSRSSSRQRRRVDEERSRRLGLSSRLEKNMAEVRAAAVVLESTNDPTTAEHVSSLLSDSILALRDGIDVIEESADDSDADGQSIASGNDSVSASSRGPAPVDVRRLRKELDDRTRALHQVEEALRNEREKSSRVRTEKDDRKEQDDEILSLRKEVHSLREQCQTNMEVLTRKERELAVLRDSLKVDDGVGYISDDGSDGTESEAGTEAAVSSVAAQFAVYGPSQAEALATLLAQGSGASPAVDAPKDSGELQVVRRELLHARTDMEKCQKQLKTEKESLANAKMIISSLEKANKSMMEDLRSRLQDSNTAIASLLEKSMQSEKTTAKLREELEAVRNEKLEERARYESELEKLRSAPDSSLRSHQKDMRLKTSLVPSAIPSAIITPLEEKKDDFFPPPPPETID